MGGAISEAETLSEKPGKKQVAKVPKFIGPSH
jgi:hypothetical protein